jgi:hypothetical protein
MNDDSSLRVMLSRFAHHLSDGAHASAASAFLTGGLPENVWSAAELQSKNEEWQLVCANVFGLQWSQRLRAMMDIRSLSSS